MSGEICSVNNAAQSGEVLNARSLVPVAVREFGEISLEKFRVGAGEEFPCHSYPRHSIFIPLNGAFVHKHRALNGSLERTITSNGSIGIIPANLRYAGCSASGGEFFGIRFGQSLLAKVAREQIYADKIELKPSFAVSNPQIEYIGLAMLAEAEAGNPAGRIYFDSATTMLAVQVLKNYAVTAPVFSDYNGGLPKYKFRRAVEYIDANLDGELALAEIAEAVEMSPFHFARLFKQTAGIAPHAFVLNRRLERAKQLLANPGKSVTEIAFDLGFSSHSHFSTFFRKHTNLTPREFRESV